TPEQRAILLNNSSYLSLVIMRCRVERYDAKGNKITGRRGGDTDIYGEMVVRDRKNDSSTVEREIHLALNDPNVKAIRLVVECIPDRPSLVKSGAIAVHEEAQGGNEIVIAASTRCRVQEIPQEEQRSCSSTNRTNIK